MYLATRPVLLTHNRPPSREHTMIRNDDTTTDTTATETVWVFRPGFGWVERRATS